MSNRRNNTLVIILAAVIALTSLRLTASQAQHQPHHAASAFLLDIESAASAVESPIICSGDTLTNNFHRNQHPVKVITEDADLMIGALLNIHADSPAGVGGGFFACGNVTPSGLIAFEALNWISTTINQEHGLINGKPVVESFIPGVRIGKSLDQVKADA